MVITTEAIEITKKDYFHIIYIYLLSKVILCFSPK